MCRLALENLTANFLRFADAARLVRTACLSGEVDNADARRAEGKCVWPPCRLAASLIGRTSFFSVHVPSTGPNCKTPPNSTPRQRFGAAHQPTTLPRRHLRLARGIARETSHTIKTPRRFAAGGLYQIVIRRSVLEVTLSTEQRGDIARVPQNVNGWRLANRSATSREKALVLLVNIGPDHVAREGQVLDRGPPVDEANLGDLVVRVAVEDNGIATLDRTLNTNARGVAGQSLGSATVRDLGHAPYNAELQ